MARSAPSTPAKKAAQVASASATPAAAPSPATAPAQPDPRRSKSDIAETSTASQSNDATSAPNKSRHRRNKKSIAGIKERSSEFSPFQTLSEGRVSRLPVVFTRDADYFFAVSKTSVRIYSRTTGQVVSTLSSGPGSHFAAITAIMINPANPLQLLTASLDGRVKVWDFLDGVLLSSFDLQLPISGMTAHASSPNTVYVLLKKYRHRDAETAPKSMSEILTALDNGAPFNSIIGHFSIDLSTHAQTQSNMPRFSRGASLRPELARIGKTREAVAIGVSPNGEWLVVVGNDKVQVARTNDLASGFTRFISSHPGVQHTQKESMTCMAFHPTDSTRLVTGDSTGRIRVWYCLQKKFMAPSKGEADDGMERHAPSAVLHWHAHAVSSLCFSPNGGHLLSGGEEGVLVVWHLGASGNASSKEFVPRLGAPLSAIAVANGLDGREQEYAVSLADGSITFVSSMTLKPTRTFTRIKIDASRHLPGNSVPVDTPAPLAVHPASRNIVLLAGHPSSLQFYDPIKDANTMELEVAPSNRVSRVEDEQIEPTRVERVVFSPFVSSKTAEQGEWMVTFDSRNLSDFRGDVEVVSESSLKFWRWNPINRRYTLNTRIDRPHDGKRLTSMTFSPSSALLVTTAADGKVRSWYMTSRKLKSGKVESYWACRSVFGYREQTPTASAFSADGSILAVGQAGSVTLWSPESNLMSMVISAPELAEGVRSLAFSGRYLGLATSTTVLIWDLILSRQVSRKAIDASLTPRLLLACPSWDRSVDAEERVFFSLVSSSDAQDGELEASDAQQIRTVVEPISLVSDREEASSSALGSTANVGKAGLTTGKAVFRTAVSSVAPIPLRTGSHEQVQEFVAISRDMDLVSFSSSPSASGGAAAGAAAESIRGISTVKKTLFDDLFGPSAFSNARADDQDDDDELLAVSADTAGGVGSGVASLFSTAPHLLPPATLLFDAFLSKILPAAQTTSAVAIESARPPLVADNEKTAAVTSEKQPSGAVQERGISDILLTDTDDLVELFKSQILIEGGGEDSLRKGNGNATATSTSTPAKKAQVNGATPATKATPVSSSKGGPQTPAGQKADASAMSTPCKSSRKRKM
ncbi:WD40 repeat [Kalmanozyma brasiliensis GHG001]|uniref:WD repeat-containing protein 75 second beta-propeller domain-containing protein n=1 Tax=Kalmanozyma brasiliensis (strain GHG001) TaxID=1365824 RepID=V5EEK5_KALBG|nr:WD40 repeat [Kalmanozyma brasiliensis GHG001]EST08931.1 WD40 repeat [Kalmanozyma brasiliensis GHG001]